MQTTLFTIGILIIFSMPVFIFKQSIDIQLLRELAIRQQSQINDLGHIGNNHWDAISDIRDQINGAIAVGIKDKEFFAKIKGQLAE